MFPIDIKQRRDVDIAILSHVFLVFINIIMLIQIVEDNFPLTWMLLVIYLNINITSFLYTLHLNNVSIVLRRFSVDLIVLIIIKTFV